MSALARHPLPGPTMWARRFCTLRILAAGPGTAFGEARVADPFEPKVLLEGLRRLCLDRVRTLGLSPESLRLLTHRFEPQGLSVVVWLPGLRGVLHTWPEHGLATLDLTGADGPELEVWLEAITAALGMVPAT